MNCAWKDKLAGEMQIDDYREPLQVLHPGSICRLIACIRSTNSPCVLSKLILLTHLCDLLCSVTARHPTTFSTTGTRWAHEKAILNTDLRSRSISDTRQVTRSKYCPRLLVSLVLSLGIDYCSNTATELRFLGACRDVNQGKVSVGSTVEAYAIVMNCRIKSRKIGKEDQHGDSDTVPVPASYHD